MNGRPVAPRSDPARPLLEVLREDLGLTGAKYGCGEGACGACTVLVEGREARSCLLAVASVAGKRVVTIEGLSRAGEGGGLHPVQEAFLAESAFQCGYCTPGMVLAVAALLAQKPSPAESEVRARLEGHICRCGSHARILAAVRRAVEASRAGAGVPEGSGAGMGTEESSR